MGGGKAHSGWLLPNKRCDKWVPGGNKFNELISIRFYYGKSPDTTVNIASKLEMFNCHDVSCLAIDVKSNLFVIN